MTRAAASARTVLIASVAVVAVASLACVPQVWAASRASRSAASAKAGAVSSSSSGALKKMSSTLQTSATASAASSSLVDVLVIQKAGTGRPSTLKTAVRVRLQGDPEREYWAGRVAARSLTKLASGSGVEHVADNGPKAPPVVPDGSGPTPARSKAAGKKGAARLKAATASGKVKAFANSVNRQVAIAGAGGQPTAWFEIGPTHKSAAAWANGFTGTGVKVAVADDGVDFGHPDLQGTQAYNTDPASPYFGWPMAFDPYSTYLYALDALTGSTSVEDGQTWFSDTAATLSADSPHFEGETYTLPATSKSGAYHIGRLWDQNLAAYWTDGTFPALLVADEHTAGVYDTVYVDLNNNKDFTDDKACTKSDPISYLDFVDHNGAIGTDGVADLSGGMVYWISDGANNPPYAEQVFADLESDAVAPPAAGSMVCVVGAYDLEASHGTLCASNVVGQGRIDGPSVAGEHPSFKTGTGGMVQGAGRDARLVAIADVYSAYALSTLMAADFVAYGPDATAGTGDEIQVMSNSYGESSVDNDEWDYASRYVTLLNTGDATSTAFLFATGNGGPGYGTNTPPSPSTGIKVGASTQFGSDGGWDSIDTSGQVTFGDVIPFSDRGPTAMGHLAPTIVADGAYASGSAALNMANGNGWTAWEIWGGTSRSTPVAAGNLALVYQAFRGAKGRWPRYDEARMLLASGATDLNYDTLVQGAGMVDADRATRLAAGIPNAGVEASPTAWYPGGYHGTAPLGFAQIVHPGDTVTAPLALTNSGPTPVDVAVSDTWMQRTGSRVVTVTLDPAKESAYTTARPDVLIDVTHLVPAGTQLLVVRATIPLTSFDTESDHTIDNQVRLLAYDWTDRNANGRLWNDANANDFVNTGEMDPFEFMRFSYCIAAGPSLEVRVQDPLGRAHDGVFVGLQHQTRSGPVQVRLELSYWNRADMPWLTSSLTNLTVPGHGTRTPTMSCAVPADAPLGTYEGQYRVSAAGTVTVVPVVITVAGESAEITYGGATPFEQLMDGAKVYGYTDWGWRPESGDWRFLTTDVAASEAGTGALLMARTRWVSAATDIDTLLYGPTATDTSELARVLGPYDLELKGGSPNTNTGGGIWMYDTSTGGPEDWVTGPLSAGLNEIMLHNVVYSGESIGETFTGRTGVLRASDTALDFVETATVHASGLTFASTMDLPGFLAVGYGLSPARTFDSAVAQGDEWTYQFTAVHAGYIEASIANEGSDLDLYLDRRVDSSWEQIAASETPSGNEKVSVRLPADGGYRVRVYGYDVAGGGASFTARVAVAQGTGLAVGGLPAGPVSAGTPISLSLGFSASALTLDQREQELLGVVACGPVSAGALQIPVSVRYGLFAAETSPVAGATNVAVPRPVIVTFSRRVDPETLGSASLYLSEGGVPVPGTISYDDATAVARITANLQPGATYRVHVTDAVQTPDGTPCDAASWTFGTATDQRATSVTLTLSASSAKYGSAVGFTVGAARGDAAPERGAPMELRFRASGSSVWIAVASGVTASNGSWSGSVVASHPGSYRAVRLPSASGLYSESVERTLGVDLAPTLSAKTRVRHRRRVRFAAHVRPAAAASKRRIRLEVYSHGRWKLVRYVRLNSHGNASFSESRGTKGTRVFRIRLSGGKGFGAGESSPVSVRWY